MTMQLKAPVPGSGGGFTDRFKLQQNKHTIRVFPFTHDDELHLAACTHMHFTGPGHNVPTPCGGKDCAHCAEAAALKDKEQAKRMRRVVRYPMAVVDMDGDLDTILRFDAPSSVYKVIYNLTQDQGAENVVGNSGIDIIIKTNANAGPSDYYAVSPLLKGSKKLNIDDESVPDLIKETLADDAPVVSTAADELPDAERVPAPKKPAKSAKGKVPVVVEEEEETTNADEPAADEPAADEDEMLEKFDTKFKDKAGEIHYGIDTKKKQNGKRIIESEGRLWPVDEKNIIK